VPIGRVTIASRLIRVRHGVEINDLNRFLLSRPAFGRSADGCLGALGKATRFVRIVSDGLQIKLASHKIMRVAW
jgi:hypothetical protein